MNEMLIGKLVKSNAHSDYICQVYGRGEIETPPNPADYALGSFVRLPLDVGHGHLVGLVYDTQLFNPDFGSLGPRLSPAADLAVFSPDYLAEKLTLVGISAIGAVSANGAVSHGLPPLAAQIDALVERMDEAAICAFHQTTDGHVRLGYAPLLLAQGSALTHHLLLNVIDQLAALLPQQSAQLAVLRSQLAWNALVGPLGGGV